MGFLCLSLGHNASAVYVDGPQVIGYEEERLSKKKADSSFPILAMREIEKYVSFADVDEIYISHWFDTFDPYEDETKYYSASFMKANFPLADIKHTQPKEDCSHHDAHAASVNLFYQNYCHEDELDMCNITVVIDGFGNEQEVASIYAGTSYEAELVDRVYGYENSLGLLYQYAAEACGMDGINDVYKFLGYRTLDLARDKQKLVDEVFQDIVYEYMPAYQGHLNKRRDAYTPDMFSPIDKEALAKARERAIGFFKPLIEASDVRDIQRCMVGRCVQRVLEHITLSWVENVLVNAELKFNNALLVAGGCFYNVRLNDKLRTMVKERYGMKFCAMPLAGDQGAGVGLAHIWQDLDPRIFDNLYWSKRSLPDNTMFEYLSDNEESVEKIVDELVEGQIVNLFMGDHEFGPRALCNTSTLALPKKYLVDAINKANGRTTVMPMAPVMTADAAMTYFGPDVFNSFCDQFMITAWDYLDPLEAGRKIPGVAHRDIDGTRSGRPQMINPGQNPFMAAILERLYTRYGITALVNTSLNIHGQPIVFDELDLVKFQDQWQEKCPTPFKTYVVGDF